MLLKGEIPRTKSDSMSHSSTRSRCLGTSLNHIPYSLVHRQGSRGQVLVGVIAKRGNPQSCN